MSQFVLTVLAAYSNNILDEAREAREALKQLYEKRVAEIDEIAVAKVAGFAAKAFGTIFLVSFVINILSLFSIRTISIGRMFKAAISFCVASDFLMVGNNLRFAYVLGPPAKAENGNDSEQTRTVLRIQQAIHNFIETARPKREISFDLNDLKLFKQERVICIAVENTRFLKYFFQLDPAVNISSDSR